MSNADGTASGSSEVTCATGEKLIMMYYPGLGEIICVCWLCPSLEGTRSGKMISRAVKVVFKRCNAKVPFRGESQSKSKLKEFQLKSRYPYSVLRVTGNARIAQTALAL